MRYIFRHTRYSDRKSMRLTDGEALQKS